MTRKKRCQKTILFYETIFLLTLDFYTAAETAEKNKED